MDGYHTWLFHGEPNHSFPNIEEVEVESSPADNELADFLRDIACGLDDSGVLEENNEDNNNPGTDVDTDTKAYLKMVDDDNKELYPGCKNFSKLRFIVKLLHIKLLGRWSDKSFDMVLELLSDAFPKGSVLPKNFNEAKKIVKSIGLGYVSIHACENDCVLFRNEYDKESQCPKCKTSRWKSESNQPYVKKHREHLSSIGLPNEKAINTMQHKKFHEWFREHVLALVERGVEVSEEIQILAQEPFMIARKLNSYTTNGFDFHTHSSDDGRPIQNSGVAIAAQNSRGVEIYYGIIREIVELNYRQKGYMVLFQCDWVDNREQDKWVKTDQFGVTTVNFNHLFSSGDKLSDEPFILASQATQVFYVPEVDDKGWCAVVQNTKPHGTYSMAAVDDDNVDDENLDLDIANKGLLIDLHTDVDPNIDYTKFSYVRTDIDGIIVAAPKRKSRSKNVSRSKKRRKNS